MLGISGIRPILGGTLLLLAGASFCAAGAIVPMQVNKAILESETVRLPESERHGYISQGQEILRDYLKDYLRGSMVRWIGTDADLQTLETGMSLEVVDLIQNSAAPFQAKMKLYADEDLNNYKNCGRFLPMEIQLDSSYRINCGIRLKADMISPLNDEPSLRMGSVIEWQRGWTTNLQCQMRGNARLYNGMNMGLGWNASGWEVNLQYSLMPDWVQLQHVRFSKSF